ncbi:hypothetical protein CALCODRAFT_507331 [Calocera cornea HHB12733]|uniref:DUF6532 domain-containing protein n=1 Tax=Calocera cornea HHB12733 TaxID=1353952 RepID=A0A165HVL4_9BASI|nr:hypothetical protein CALCODRAFT_507331 [Calocera cornea HHB12733]
MLIRSEVEGAGFHYARFQDYRESSLDEMLAWAHRHATPDGRWRDANNRIHVEGIEIDTAAFSSVIMDGEAIDHPGLVGHLRNQAQKEYNYLIGVAPTLATMLKTTEFNELRASLRLGRTFALENDRERLRRVFVSRGWVLGTFERSMERLYRPCDVDWDSDTDQNLWCIVSHRRCSPQVLPAFVFPQSPYDSVEADFVPFCALLLLQAYRILFPRLQQLVDKQRCGVFVRVSPSIPGFEVIFPSTLAYTVVQLRYIMMGNNADDDTFDYDKLWGTVMVYFTASAIHGPEIAALPNARHGITYSRTTRDPNRRSVDRPQSESSNRSGREASERERRDNTKPLPNRRLNVDLSSESEDEDDEKKLILTGPSHLVESYPEAVQKSIGEIKAQLRMSIASYNAWPKNTAVLDALIEESLKLGNSACEKKEWPTVESSEGLLRGTVSQFRGFVKSEARKLVDEYYDFANKEKWRGRAEIKEFVGKILNPDRAWYLFETFDESNPTKSSGFARNPVFVKLVRNVYFRENAPTSDGITHSSQFEFETSEFFAFNFSAIYAALSEWKTGRPEVIKFATEDYRAPWIYLVGIFDAWRKRCAENDPDDDKWLGLVRKTREEVWYCVINDQTVPKSLKLIDRAGIGPVGSQDWAIQVLCNLAGEEPLPVTEAERLRNRTPSDNESDTDQPPTKNPDNTNAPLGESISVPPAGGTGGDRRSGGNRAQTTTPGVAKARTTVEGRRLYHRKQVLASMRLVEDNNGIRRLGATESIDRSDEEEEDQAADGEGHVVPNEGGPTGRGMPKRGERKTRPSSRKVSKRKGRIESDSDDDYMVQDDDDDGQDDEDDSAEAEEDEDSIIADLTKEEKDIVRKLSPYVLAAYPPDAQKTIQLTKAHLRIEVATVNGFPKDGDAIGKMIARAMQGANEEGADSNLPLIAATPGLVKMLRNEPSRFRSNLKATARAVVDEVYAFEDRKQWPNSKSVGTFLKPLLAYHKGLFTMKNFNRTDPEASSGIFENPALARLILDHYYRPKSEEADARTHPSAFTPYSIEFIALNFTVLLNVLEEWSSGMQKMIALSSEAYRAEWLWMINSIKRFDELSRGRGDNKWQGIVDRLEAWISDEQVVSASQDPKLKNVDWVTAYAD